MATKSGAHELRSSSPQTKKARTSKAAGEASKGSKMTKMEEGQQTTGAATEQLGGGGTTILSEFVTDPAFLHTLTRLKAESLPLSDGKIFVCQRTDTLVDVWQGLIKHGFLAVPVLQKTGNKYYGFVDLADIMRFVVHTFGAQKLEAIEDVWEMLKGEEYFQKRTVNDIMKYPLSLRNPFHPVTRGYSLFHVCEVLAREKGLQRVPIINEDRHLINIITLSRLVAFVHHNLEALGNVRNKPASRMRYIAKEFLTVKESDKALDAFNRLSEHNVYGAAVVDNEGKLTGSLSVRDLKAIQTDGRMFWRLADTVKVFLDRLKADFEVVRPRHLVSVKRDDTLEHIVKELEREKIHRIFVVDDNNKPINVITLQDVLYEIISS